MARVKDVSMPAKEEAVKDFSEHFVVDDAPGPSASRIERETDEHRLCQRQKQIDFGKNTIGYGRYTKAVPRHKRKRSDPHTPDIEQKVSKRNFDEQVKKWRRRLHEWDIDEGEAAHVFVSLHSSNLEAPGAARAAEDYLDHVMGEAEASATEAQGRNHLPRSDTGSKKRSLLQGVEVNVNANKRQNRQHLQPKSRSPSSQSRSASSGRGGGSSEPSTWQEDQENQEGGEAEGAVEQEAAVVDIFQDWEDDIQL